MARRKSPRPTDRELTILRILWDKGPSTVRDVNKAMNEDGNTGYTTTLKLMQIMVEKGLVLRDDSQFKHIYRPALTEEKASARPDRGKGPEAIGRRSARQGIFRLGGKAGHAGTIGEEGLGKRISEH
jgi:hypothetical protein